MSGALGEAGGAVAIRVAFAAGGAVAVRVAFAVVGAVAVRRAGGAAERA